MNLIQIIHMRKKDNQHFSLKYSNDAAFLAGVCNDPFLGAEFYWTQDQDAIPLKVLNYLFDLSYEF